MLDTDTLTSFKLTTIRLIEEFLKERITQIDPDAIEKKKYN